MSTLAKLGWGSTFQSGDGNSPETLFTVAEITNISLPTISVDEIDCSHEMPPNSTRESFPGFIDSGTVKLDLNLLPSSMTLFFGELNNKPIRNRVITIPDQSGLGTTWTFRAYLIAVESAAPVADRMTLSATFRITGATTFAPHPPGGALPPFTIGVSEIGGIDPIP